jgi:hypothetical protein
MLSRMADPDDLIKNAGRFFSKLGGQLKDVGKTVGAQVKQTSKQVTGLGRGSVKLELEQTKVAPGGTLRGKLVLALTERVEAKRLVVTLRARQRFIAVKSGDGKGVGATHAEVYQFDKELAPAQIFEAETFELALDVPPDALELRAKPPSGSNPVADVARTVASALTPTAGPIEWQVIGRLEIAWGRDLTSEVDIVVSR